MKTKKGWENLWKEIKAVSPDTSKLTTWIWLQATKGDIGGKLGRLDHWPEGVEAEEGVWRDYYTGEQLENYTNSCYKSNGGKDMGEAYNCVYYRSTFAQTRTWIVWQCLSTSLRGFPCTYVSPPLIHLRGSCPDTQLEKSYTVTQFASDPKNIIMVGTVSAQIRFLCSWQTKLDSIRLQVQMF